MSKITWGLPGSKNFEAGLDRGVFYPPNSRGVPWNGLTSVTESPNSNGTSEYYLDGIVFLNIPGSEKFAGSIECLSYPTEFSPYDGVASVSSVLFIAQQPRKSFGLSYRTKMGNDLNGLDSGYKIHLIYNALIEPTEKQYKSIGENVEPITYSWSFSTTPVSIPGYRPTAHLVVNSLNSAFISNLEDRLYGTDSTDSYLPSPLEIISLLNAFF